MKITMKIYHYNICTKCDSNAMEGRRNTAFFFYDDSIKN